MTTRDPRSREHPTATPAGDGGRESTQSLNLEPPLDGDPSPEALGAALALGTHNRQITRIVSPPHLSASARHARRTDSPDDYLDAVLGSYRVIELLGKGGMGYVYRAEHVKLGREVALKLLRGDYASRRDAVARFFQEARTVNRVRHRNIVDVTDFVELDDGTTYIIMELLTGTSLGAWARTGIDLPRALAVLVQICDGLAAAHEVGVVHRDLKPDNVIVVPTPDGAELVKLLDFGVAKLLNRDDEDVGFQTAAGSVIGTPAYMSPEQAGGMVIDARSDIYSLGAIMYELFCGEPMFRGHSFGEYVRKHLTEMPVPPRQTPGGAELAPELEALILKCLDKDPDQRFAHIVELRDALLHLLGSTGSALLNLAGMTGNRMPLQSLQLPVGPQAGYTSTPSSQMSRQSGGSGGSGLSQIPGISGGSGRSGVSQTPGRSGGFEMSQIPGRSGGPGGSVISGAHPSQISAQHSYTPPPTPAAASPWWVWFVGGAVAVGIGVAAAIWYAGRDTPDRAVRAAPSAPSALSPPSAPSALSPPSAPSALSPPAIAMPLQPAAHPTAQPIEPPPVRAELFEVRFDSSPSGGVFAEGHAAELCRTPCTFHIDPADGGPTDHRAFAVKRDGYSDSAITVDLAGTTREFHVMLRHAAPPPAAEHADARADKRPTKRPVKTTRQGGSSARDSSARDSSARDSSARDSSARDSSARDSSARDSSAKAPRDTAREVKDTRDPDLDRLLDPTDGKPAANKPAGKPTIDPADTLDPFRKK